MGERFASLPLTKSERSLLLFLGSTAAVGLAALLIWEIQTPRFHPVLIQGTPGERFAVDLSGAAAKTSAPFPLDLNSANPFQLQALPGIGKKLAFRIAEDRTLRGRYRTPQDLLRVKGITQKKLAAIRKFVTAKP